MHGIPNMSVNNTPTRGKLMVNVCTKYSNHRQIGQMIYICLNANILNSLLEIVFNRQIFGKYCIVVSFVIFCKFVTNISQSLAKKLLTVLAVEYLGNI